MTKFDAASAMKFAQHLKEQDIMKASFSIGVAAFALLASRAFAADLPVRTLPPPPLPAPAFTWAGAYIGINAGYAFDHEGNFDTFANAPVNTGLIFGDRPGQLATDSDGFTGGGQVGYNFQIPSLGSFGGPVSGIVLGVEADAAYTSLDHSQNYLGNHNYTSTFNSGLDFLGTVRGRLGYAFGQFLIYGTGGFAYGEADNSILFRNQVGTTTFFGSESKIDTGYAYGGGIEYALPTGSILNFFRSSAVTVKAEYLRYDLGRDTILLGAVGPGLGSYTERVTNNGDLVRMGLNYKFGSS